MDTTWEVVFMLLVLKIPMVYLGVVVWYALKAEPAPGGEDEVVGVLAPLDPCGWDEWQMRRHSRSRARTPVRPFGPRGRAGGRRLPVPSPAAGS